MVRKEEAGGARERNGTAMEPVARYQPRPAPPRAAGDPSIS